MRHSRPDPECVGTGSKQIAPRQVCPAQLTPIVVTLDMPGQEWHGDNRSADVHLQRADSCDDPVTAENLGETRQQTYGDNRNQADAADPDQPCPSDDHRFPWH